MNLPTLQKNWDLLASTDPLWAILTDPAKKNSGWDVEEFFNTGVWEVRAALDQVERLQPLARRECALDFGCGVGRLSQALAGRFARVWGVDIAPTMIELARKYNRHGERCQFWLNSGSDLAHFADAHFDFIYSSITLQHMEPRFARRYIQEFVRVLAPDGVALFQLPARARKGRLWHFFSQRMFGAVLSRRVRHGRPVIGMYGIEKSEVVRLVGDAGGTILDIHADQSAGPDWESYRYFVTKRAAAGG